MKLYYGKRFGLYTVKVLKSDKEGIKNYFILGFFVKPLEAYNFKKGLESGTIRMEGVE